MQGMPRAGVDIAETYRSFAEMELAVHSPLYATLCRGVAADPEVLDRIRTLPGMKQQPNLLLGAVRWLGGPIDGYAAFRAFVLVQWDQLRPVILARRTQTNEAGRCGTLLPAFAAIAATTGRPLALIEVGASAGLCLYPDRYRYSYDGAAPIGPANALVELPVATSGAPPIPAAVPPVAWRAGIDLNPLDVTDPGDMKWLECLVWPEQADRLTRLHNAIATARRDPPLLVRGDLNEALASLVAKAPRDAAVVVFHTAVLAYVDEDDRSRFAEQVASLPVHWVSNEVPEVFPEIAAKAPPASATSTACLLAVDAVPVAYAAPHGQRLDWL
jgi:hypothetical protein